MIVLKTKVIAAVAISVCVMGGASNAWAYVQMSPPNQNQPSAPARYPNRNCPPQNNNFHYGAPPPPAQNYGQPPPTGPGQPYGQPVGPQMGPGQGYGQPPQAAPGQIPDGPNVPYPIGTQPPPPQYPYPPQQPNGPSSAPPQDPNLCGKIDNLFKDIGAIRQDISNLVQFTNTSSKNTMNMLNSIFAKTANVLPQAGFLGR